MMAEAKMSGIHIRGRDDVAHLSMLVPRPWAARPPQRFSRKLMTAKPTI